MQYWRLTNLLVREFTPRTTTKFEEIGRVTLKVLPAYVHG